MEKDKETEIKDWKRVWFKDNKAWIATDAQGMPVSKDGKVLIKYQIKQDYEYWVNKKNVRSLDSSPTKSLRKKKSKSRNKNFKKFEADIVFGRVVSFFSEDVPDWVKKCFIYNRLAPKTGTVAKITRTGNCIIKTALLKEIPGPFDPQYGNSGGEDTHLFDKLRQNGAKFVNCYEAWTAEFVPSERTTFSWLLMRALRTGNSYARRSIELAGKRKIRMRLHHTIVGFTYSIISLLLMIITFPSRVKRLHWALKTVANCGKILAVFGYFPQEYR